MARDHIIEIANTMYMESPWKCDYFENGIVITTSYSGFMPKDTHANKNSIGLSSKITFIPKPEDAFCIGELMTTKFRKISFYLVLEDLDV